MTDKLILRALRGEVLPQPPVWIMRQAGRYLPEYRAVRDKAGSFLNLCYTPELAAEVTMQPIRRFGFDAAILFADILLVPQALGSNLTFVEGEGPRLSKVNDAESLRKLGSADSIHNTLGPIYETVRLLKSQLPPETALIGFAGAPWTVASYMIAGQGTPDQAPALRLMYESPEIFFPLLDLISDATAEYLRFQIAAGVDVIKLFDSWAGTVPGAYFDQCCIQPTIRILDKVRSAYPNIPVIGFPRGCGGNYPSFVAATKVECLAVDTTVSLEWIKDSLPTTTCIQGNLDPFLLELGGEALAVATEHVCRSLSDRPHIFNLGHGITPKGNPRNIEAMLRIIRG
jgi:uroporphyrinogen decarboxylase